MTSDLAGFDECYFGASHTSQLTVTSVDGGPGTGPGSGEAALDLDDVSAIAPAAKIHVFSGPNQDNPFGPLDTWNAIAVADDARQVTSSWGLCETVLQEGAPGTQQVENEIFEQTAAQGQTIFSSAGDDGSDDCASHNSTPVVADLSVDDPASQPYVTSVGGTTIVNATDPPEETVWNNGSSGGAGGGGISETWAMPSWQRGVAIAQTAATEPCSDDPSGTADDFHVAGVATTLTAGTECREVPDVSALADPQTGITIEYNGSWTPIGGTSSSTPLWAAMLAEINGSSACSSLTDGVGFADPLLYQVASSPSEYAQAFNDVRSGNNDNLDVGGGLDWQAQAGYDLATGLGTPRITDANGAPGLAAQLCQLAAGTEATAPPVVTSLSPLSGPLTGGGEIHIIGSNFGSSGGSVFFGDVAAAVVTWSANTITADVPAYDPPQGTPSGAAGSADVTVVTAGHESSALGAAAVYHFDAVSPSGGPVVDYVSAPAGPTGGGNDVTIVGAGLSGATAVSFGDVAATGLVQLGDNELRVTVPASDGVCAVPSSQGTCAVAVTVTTPKGTSSGPAILPAYQGPITFAPDGSLSAPNGCGCEVDTAPDEYDYAPTPTLTSVSPSPVGTNGGTETITGTGFNLLSFEWADVGPAAENFSEDFSIEGVTPTALTILFPFEPPSVEETTIPLSVQSFGGLSNELDVPLAGIPVVTGLSRHVAAEATPGNVTVTGQGLSDVTSMVLELQGPLSFLSSTSTEITNQSDTSLTVRIPEGYAAPADVLLCTASGCSFPDPADDTLTLAYAGRPIVSNSSPLKGPARGSGEVTINGVLDSEVTAVDFGSKAATIVSEPSFTASGPIVVLAPPNAAGAKVNITITTLGGTVISPPTPRSAVTSAATYTYVVSTPAAPRHVTAQPGLKQALISWSEPTSDGGSKITGYVLVARASGKKTVTNTVGPAARERTLYLAAGPTWTVSVSAINALGKGLAATAEVVTV